MERIGREMDFASNSMAGLQTAAPHNRPPHLQTPMKHLYIHTFKNGVKLSCESHQADEMFDVAAKTNPILVPIHELAQWLFTIETYFATPNHESSFNPKAE